MSHKLQHNIVDADTIHKLFEYITHSPVRHWRCQ